MNPVADRAIKPDSGVQQLSSETAAGDDPRLAATQTPSGTPIIDDRTRPTTGLGLAVADLGSLIGSDGVLKISDFGLVRRVGEDGLTVNGQVMGTISYLSPEQAESRACDARTDLYALGIVFYEMLAGHVPFRADTPAGVIYQHVHTPPEALRRVNPAIDAATAAICTQLLAKDPYISRTATVLVDPAPTGGSAKYMVVKGGCYSDDATGCRLARRQNERGYDRTIGFCILVTELPADLR